MAAYLRFGNSESMSPDGGLFRYNRGVFFGRGSRGAS
jgi:hypothetical protein